MGGDADTMGAITGAMAYAYYRSMPRELAEFAENKLSRRIWDIVVEFGER